MKTIQTYSNKAPTAGKKVHVAYYRLTKEMKDFLELLNEKEDIIGFEWTPGEFNFGIIIKNKSE